MYVDCMISSKCRVNLIKFIYWLQESSIKYLSWNLQNSHFSWSILLRVTPAAYLELHPASWGVFRSFGSDDKIKIVFHLFFFKLFKAQYEFEIHLIRGIAARGAAAERKNPLISPIAIFAPLSTLDYFNGKEWSFLFKKFWKNVRGRILKKTQTYV